MDPNLHLVLALSALHTRIFKMIDKKLSIHGVTFTEFLVMHHLDADSEKMMRRIDLAECIGLSASGVTRLLSPMEKLKIVEKEANPRDARVSFVRLSDAGVLLYRNILLSVSEAADVVFGPLEPTEVEALLGLSKKIA